MEINELNLRDKIKELAQKNVDLDKKGGPERAGRLFEKCLEIEDAILAYYKIPSNPYYQSFLRFDSVPWDNEIDKLIEFLERESKNLKEGPNKSDVEILIESKARKRDPMFALPAIGVTPHVYSIWVYENILLKSRDMVENVLIEFKRLNYDLLDTIGNMDNKNEWRKNPEEFIKTMEKKGLIYIRSYVKSKL